MVVAVAVAVTGVGDVAVACVVGACIALLLTVLLRSRCGMFCAALCAPYLLVFVVADLFMRLFRSELLQIRLLQLCLPPRRNISVLISSPSLLVVWVLFHGMCFWPLC